MHAYCSLLFSNLYVVFVVDFPMQVILLVCLHFTNKPIYLSWRSTKIDKNKTNIKYVNGLFVTFVLLHFTMNGIHLAQQLILKHCLLTIMLKKTC